MPKFVINGSQKLSGEIAVKGAKNLALKLFPAALLSDQVAEFSNIPEIEDIHRMIEIMESLGVKVTRVEEGKYRLDASGLNKTIISEEQSTKLRSSIMLAGPILARHHEVEIYHPGGCSIGQRPIDLFIDAFKTFGAEVIEDDTRYIIRGSQLKGAEIVMPIISVTATESIMMTACLIEGTTTIVNSAMEPEIVALAEYLNSNGAKITGAGSPIITIEGVKKLSNGTFTCIPDRIEAGSFTVAALITQSHLTITNCQPKHLTTFLHLLKKAGARIVTTENSIEVFPSEIKAQDMRTHEYPGIATDLQAPYTVLMTQAQGMCLIHETIYEGRLLYTDMLNTMGANIIMCDPHRVVVQGPAKLRGKKITSPDLRAGMGLILASLAAEGTSTIDNIYQIKRGYQDIVERLQKVGADIKQID